MGVRFILLLTVLLPLVGFSTTASACYCAPLRLPSLLDSLSRAEVVFHGEMTVPDEKREEVLGKIAAFQACKKPDCFYGGETLSYPLIAERVWKGDVAEDMVFHATIDTATSCMMGLSKEYSFIMFHKRQEYRDGWCRPYMRATELNLTTVNSYFETEERGKHALLLQVEIEPGDYLSGIEVVGPPEILTAVDDFCGRADKGAEAPFAFGVDDLRYPLTVRNGIFDDGTAEECREALLKETSFRHGDFRLIGFLRSPTGELRFASSKNIEALRP